MIRPLESALKKLAEAGLNVYASSPLKDLPAKIIADLVNEGIDLSASVSVVLLASGGRTLWSKLSHPLDSARHPIDEYTKSRIRELNEDFLHDRKLQLLYPHPKWMVPLQRLGRFLNMARPSKLGLDIHPFFGPWFAYRAAFLTSVELPASNLQEVTSPCETCESRACMGQCPSGAVKDNAFDLSACADFRLSEASPCHDRCLARMACPVGREHQYSLEQMQYHMLRPSHLKRLASYGKKK